MVDMPGLVLLRVFSLLVPVIFNSDHLRALSDYININTWSVCIIYISFDSCQLISGKLLFFFFFHV